MDHKLFDDLGTRFTYHPPKSAQPQMYQEIRDDAKSFAETMVQLCPESRELDIAMQRLEEAVFWANAAIARRG